jgi:hypothetical protein
MSLPPSDLASKMSIVAEVVMSFSSETKTKDIALANSMARQILEDAGVDYCCGGGIPCRKPACIQTPRRNKS